MHAPRTHKELQACASVHAHTNLHAPCITYHTHTHTRTCIHEDVHIHAHAAHAHTYVHVKHTYKQTYRDISLAEAQFTVQSRITLRTIITTLDSSLPKCSCTASVVNSGASLTSSSRARDAFNIVYHHISYHAMV